VKLGSNDIFFFFWGDKESKDVLIIHQGDVIHVQKGQNAKIFALKLSSIIESTKSIKLKFLLPLSTTLQPYNIIAK